MKTTAKTYVAFTIDVDPDVNVPAKGQIGVVSNSDQNDEVRFESTKAGLSLIIELLKDLEIESTFFFEARTAEILNEALELSHLMQPHEVGCHSLHHEDFTLKDPNIALERADKIEIISKSLEILDNIFPNHSIIGFRAPYCKIDLELANVLEVLKFKYDSSVSHSWNFERQSDTASWFKPVKIKGTTKVIIELPMPIWLDDQNQPLSSYLWPFLESERVIEDYYTCLEKSTKIPNDEIIILGTHPWHIIETYKSGKLTANKVTSNVEQIKGLLTYIKSLPKVEFIRLDKYIEIFEVGANEIEIK